MGIIGYTDENKVFHPTVASATISNDANNIIRKGTDGGLYAKQDNSIVTDEYSPTKPYTVGERCIYNNKLYRCIANTSAGVLPTNTTYFVETTLDAELNNISSNVNYKIRTGTTTITLGSNGWFAIPSGIVNSNTKFFDIVSNTEPVWFAHSKINGYAYDFTNMKIKTNATIGITYIAYDLIA